MPLGFTYDHVGPLARSVADCAAVLDVIAGPDANDASTVDAGPLDLAGACGRGIDGLRVGVARSVTVDAAGATRVAAAFDDAVAALERPAPGRRGRGAALRDELHDACFLGLFAEAFAWHRPLLAEHWDDYGGNTRMSIALGGLISAADHVQIERVRQVGRRAVRRAARRRRRDRPPDHGDHGASVRGRTRPGDEAAVDVHADVELARLPVAGGADGLRRADCPTSLLVNGRPFDDATVAAVGAAYQDVTDWHRRRPAI